MALENIILSEVSQAQKEKATCFLSYVECRPNANTVILWKTGHGNGKLHIRGGGEMKEVKKVNMVDVLSMQEWI
jgi:hypothetical protein